MPCILKGGGGIEQWRCTKNYREKERVKNWTTNAHKIDIKKGWDLELNDKGDKQPTQKEKEGLKLSDRGDIRHA